MSGFVFTVAFLNFRAIHPMNRILILLFTVLISREAFSQNDSVVYTKYDVYSTDDTNRMYRYIIREFFSSEHKFVVALAKDHNVTVASNLSAPKQFIHRVKVDSGSYVRVTIDAKDGSQTVTYPDSVDRVDWVAVDSFYTNTDSIHIDTIYVEKWKYFHPEFTNVIDKASTCGYIYDLKHGRETSYYGPHQLAGAVVTSKKFGLRYTGKWEYGERIGKWRYYTPDGELQRTEKWKNGRLIKTKYP